MIQQSSLLLTIDVAHPFRPPDTVEQEMLQACSEIRTSSSVRVLKIIHGHGSSRKGGMTKNVVRNWAFKNRGRFRLVIDGEQYSVYNHDTQDMRKEVGQFTDPDLDRANPGITLIWVK